MRWQFVEVTEGPQLSVLHLPWHSPWQLRGVVATVLSPFYSRCCPVDHGNFKSRTPHRMREHYSKSLCVAIDRIDARTSQIRRRRKRLDFILPDGGRLVDLSPVRDGIREAYPLPGDVLTLEGHADESCPVFSQIGSHSESALPTPTNQPITVHEFLLGMSASGRAGRKYGRRNRLATVKLDAYDRSEVRRSPSPRLGPTPITPSSLHAETRDDQLERISAYYPRIVHKRPSRRVPHPRRKKQLAKSLAQRLFEADVFSSGTSSSRPISDRDPAAHTSARRPLQFITSLNLTPSLSRIYPPQKWAHHHGEAAREASSESAAADLGIWAAADQAEADDSAPDTSWSNGLVAATCGEPPSRSWNGTRTGSPAAPVLASGKRAFRMRGGRQSAAAAQVQPTSPFEYVPLPLVRVELAPRIRSYAHQPPQCQYRSGCTRGGARMRGRQANFNLMSASGLRHGFIAARPPGLVNVAT